MSFALPTVLFLLVIPLAWIMWDLTRRKFISEQGHPKILSANAGTDKVTLETASTLLKPNRKSRILLASGLFFAIIALARPQWGHIEEPEKRISPTRSPTKPSKRDWISSLERSSRVGLTSGVSIDFERSSAMSTSRD